MTDRLRAVVGNSILLFIQNSPITQMPLVNIVEKEQKM